MTLYEQLLASLELIIALVLSGIIGLERDRRGQPAGLRTHMMVGLGACLFTILSRFTFPNSETARVAAQVVTGVGFLGAGTILQRRESDRFDIKHLTTAASIWVTAAVGMAVGSGVWLLAVNATLMSWVVLTIIRHFSKDTRSESSPPENATES